MAKTEPTRPKESPADRMREAELSKLELERRALEQQLSPEARRVERIKAYAGLGGVLAGLAALLSFTLSSWQTASQLDAAREAKLDERLDKALERLAAKDAATQLSGIATLRDYVTGRSSAQRRHLLSALAHILSVEEKPIVRRAIVDTFAALAPSDPDGREAALASLVETSRSLVVEEKLFLERALDQPSAPAELRALSVGSAIEAIVRAGVRQPVNLSAIYCRGCNFSGLSLTGADFDRAILEDADFTNADLQEASFANSDLQNARFVAADLRKARITYDPESGPSWFELRARTFKAVFGELVEKAGKAGDAEVDRRPWLWLVRPPRFWCADLRDTSFQGYPLFAFAARNAKLNDQTSILGAVTASFLRADLRGADFGRAATFGVSYGFDTPFTGSYRRVQLKGDIEFWVAVHRAADSEITFQQDPDYAGAIIGIRRALAGTNWRAAKWPGWLQPLLKVPVDVPPYELRRLTCHPRNR